MAKTAAAEYFHSLVAPERNREALGTQFCKLAAGFNKDPWDLAEQVAPTINSMRVLSKTASGEQAELAQFYVAWADGMMKQSQVGLVSRMLGRGGSQRAASAVTSAGRRAAGVAPAARASAPAGGITRPAKDVSHPLWQKALGAAGVTGMVGVPAYYGAKSALTP
jgi:hypothetical protein